MPPTAYTRLHTDERRRLLLERATELFATHGYDELSMAKLAREAGISKALLYHYFPSKRDLFAAALTDAAEELRARTEPEPGRPPAEQLALALDAFLRWVEDHGAAYAKLLRSASLPEVRELVGAVRERTARRILAELGQAGEQAPARAAVRGWLWFCDGVCLDWIEHRDLRRDEVHGLLLGTLAGALAAAGDGPLPG